MKRILSILIFITAISKAQNLVPNWSFETYTACPSVGSEIPSATPWTGPTSNSSDYFNSCASVGSGLSVPNQGGYSFQYAKDGNAFAAIYLLNGFGSGYREYLQVKLTDSLASGVCYYVEFYANLCNINRFATNNVAANFSSMAYPTTYTAAWTTTALNVPQHITNYGNPIIKDTLNWVKISGLYTGTGTEKYIALGNFKDNANTDTMTIFTGSGNYYGTYCFFDAVSVYSINPTGNLPWTYSNTSVNIGDSVYIGNTMGGIFTSNWYTYSGTFIKSGSGIYVKPVTTSTYVVQFTVCGVPRSDTLTVTVTGLGIKENVKSLDIKIFPNPAVNTLYIVSKEFIDPNTQIEIKNTLGQTVFKCSFKKEIDISTLANGCYFIKIQSKDQQYNSKFIKE